MSPRTWDKLAIGSWYIGAAAFGVAVILTIIGLTRYPELSPFSSWTASEPEITATSGHNNVTFLEMETFLLATKGMTSLQTRNLAQRWEGERVIWDGFVTNVGGSLSVVVVSMEPRLYRDALEHIGGVWAQAHFNIEYQDVLLLLRKEQGIRVSCEFDRLFLWNNPVLVDCHLVDVKGRIEHPAPSCEDDDINCHPETAPNPEGTVS